MVEGQNRGFTARQQSGAGLAIKTLHASRSTRIVLASVALVACAGVPEPSPTGEHGKEMRYAFVEGVFDLAKDCRETSKHDIGIEIGIGNPCVMLSELIRVRRGESQTNKSALPDFFPQGGSFSASGN